jgi:hypothetical protein
MTWIDWSASFFPCFLLFVSTVLTDLLPTWVGNDIDNFTLRLLPVVGLILFYRMLLLWKKLSSSLVFLHAVIWTVAVLSLNLAIFAGLIAGWIVLGTLFVSLSV